MSFFKLLSLILPALLKALDSYWSKNDGADVTVPSTNVIKETRAKIKVEKLEDKLQKLQQKNEPSLYPKCYILDPGHGKLTKGKRSPVWHENGQALQFMEYEFNRDIARRIGEQLTKLGIEYTYTVDLDDPNIGNDLQLRVKNANKFKTKKDKIFISIHSNAGPTPGPNEWSTAKGLETWYKNNSIKGRAIATLFQAQLVNHLPNFVDRGLKYHTKPRLEFYVLKKTNMPAVLTESGFYNNKQEVKLLIDNDYRQKIADAHVAAIIELESNKL